MRKTVCCVCGVDSKDGNTIITIKDNEEFRLFTLTYGKPSDLCLECERELVATIDRIRGDIDV